MSLSVRMLLGDRDPVDLRQTQVEQHQVGQELAHVVERDLAVAGDAHVVALQSQRALQSERDVLVVLDDEHARGATVGHWSMVRRDLKTSNTPPGPARARCAGVCPRVSKSRA